MFTLLKQDQKTKARLGLFRTRRGAIQTPAFFPVATQATVKALSCRDLVEIGVPGVLVNAYHLYLRPGVDIIKQHGGLQRFMNFHGTIITDSGGYQIFSLEGLRKVSDDGVVFQSHFDGKKCFLSPQDVIQIQLDLGSDVIVPLDECVKYPAQYLSAKEAMLRTIEWLKDSKQFFLENNSRDILFFGIVQGSIYEDLRLQCLEQMMSIGVDGVCFGGLSVGEPQDMRYNILSFLGQKIDKNYLRYFMGYGLPEDILEAVSLGIDLFDCVLPTRLGRSGTAFTSYGKLIVRDAPYAFDLRPLDTKCSCFVCRDFSRAYIRHLINVNEMLGAQLLSFHNVFWYTNFMSGIRQAISEERFSEFKADFLAEYGIDAK